MADYQMDDFFQRFLDSSNEVTDGNLSLPSFDSPELPSSIDLHDDFWKELLRSSQQTPRRNSILPFDGLIASPAFSPHDSEGTPSLNMTERTLSSDSCWPTPSSDPIPLASVLAPSDDLGWMTALISSEDDKVFLGTPAMSSALEMGDSALGWSSTA
jgi:hypothetical protein